MGAWGFGVFENDTACDWRGDLAEGTDLELVRSAFRDLEEVGNEYLDADIACKALAGCEVLAWLRGRPGVQKAYTEKLNAWKARCRPLPTPELVTRAVSAIGRILGEHSELRQLWDETDDFPKWKISVENVLSRLTT